MWVIRIGLVLGAAILTVAILRAFGLADFFASFGRVAADPWGLVGLMDLYLGFIGMSVIMALVERRHIAVALIVALFLLGNVVSAVWVVWRLPTLARALAKVMA